MLTRVRSSLLKIKNKVLKPSKLKQSKTNQKNEPVNEFDFRGNKIQKTVEFHRNKLFLNKEQRQFDYKYDDELYQMQPRKTRGKNLFYLGLFGAWYFLVIFFITKRVGGNDLEELEQEAMQRLNKIEKARNL